MSISNISSLTFENFLKISKHELIYGINSNHCISYDKGHDVSYKYLLQLTNIEDYMKTTYTTNSPQLELSNAMVLEGWIEAKLITPEFLKNLTNHKYSFIITRRASPVNDEEQTILHQFIQPDSIERLIVYEMLFKWIYDQDKPISPDAHERSINFRETFFNSNAKYLPSKVREIYSKSNCFIFTFNSLTAEDRELITNLKNSPFYNGNHNPSSMVIYKVEANRNCNCRDNSLQCIKRLTTHIEKGDIYHIIIENNYDPTDRNLYSNIFNFLISAKYST